MPEMGSPDSGTPASTVTSDGSGAKDLGQSYTGTKHKVKVNEREMEVPYEELVSNYQLRRASEERFQQASEMAKRTAPLKQWIDDISKGDLKKLKGLVPDDVLYRFAHDTLKEFVDYNDMPEAERKALEASKERDKYKTELEQIKERQELAKRQQFEQEAGQKLEKDLSDALSEVGEDIRVTPKLARRVVEIMLAKDLPAKEAAKFAVKGLEEEYSEYQQRRFAKDPNTFLASVPKPILEALRKAEIAKAKSKQAPWVKPKDNTQQVKRRPKTVGWDALDKQFGKG